MAPHAEGRPRRSTRSRDRGGQIKRDRSVRSATPVRREPGQLNQEPTTFFNNSHADQKKKKKTTWHDNTGIHANSCFPDQSAQMASWKLAYCWIIHSLQLAKGKKKPWLVPASLQFCASLRLHPKKITPKNTTTTDDFMQHWRSRTVCSGCCSNIIVVFAAASQAKYQCAKE